MIITARKRSLGQGNIFTPVCHSVHRGGLPSRRPPGKEAPPGRETSLGRRHPPARETPLGWRHPPWQGDPPGRRHPRQGDPPGRRYPPGGRHPLPWEGGTPPSRETPRKESPPPRRLLLRAVRILLECILVSILVFFEQTNLVFCWYFCVTPKLNKLEVAGYQIKSKINLKQGL